MSDNCPACNEEQDHHAPFCNECDTKLNYPEDYIYDLIEKFPKTRTFKHCDIIHTISNLEIYGECSVCGQRMKLRAFGAPKEIQDIILLCRRWLVKAGKMSSEF